MSQTKKDWQRVRMAGRSIVTPPGWRRVRSGRIHKGDRVTSLKVGFVYADSSVGHPVSAVTLVIRRLK